MNPSTKEEKRIAKNKYQVKWDKEHRERRRQIITKYRHKLREDVLKIFGSKCNVCGFSDPRTLQVDHINGGGSGQRKEFNNRQALYLHILLGEINGLQLLCANCNWIKRCENKEWHNNIQN